MMERIQNSMCDKHRILDSTVMLGISIVLTGVTLY